MPSLVAGRRGHRAVHRPRPTARPDFTVTDDNVAPWCARSAGGSTACRWRSSWRRRGCGPCRWPRSSTGLHDRFRLLTGGSRTAVRRQQTLRASVDWSHALLTETERVLFRRLAVFMGGFDLDAAQAVAGGGEVERYQVWISSACWSTSRWWWPKTSAAERDTGCSRRCASTRRKNSASPARPTRYDPSIATTTGPGGALDNMAVATEAVVDQAENEIDNLRTAFAWSREGADIELALRIASSLQPLWLTRGRLREGLAWLNEVLTGDTADGADLAPAIYAPALADQAFLGSWAVATDHTGQAEHALAMAREVGDPALLVRVLTSCIGRPRSTPRQCTRTSKRRWAWRESWAINGDSARSSAGRRTSPSSGVIQFRRAPPAKKGGGWLGLPATPSSRASVGTGVRPWLPSNRAILAKRFPCFELFSPRPTHPEMS